MDKMHARSPAATASIARERLLSKPTTPPHSLIHRLIELGADARQVRQSLAPAASRLPRVPHARLRETLRRGHRSLLEPTYLLRRYGSHGAR